MHSSIDTTEHYMMGTYGRFPLVLEKGEGCYLYDTEGNAYLDFCAGIATNTLGYQHPKLTEALKSQLDRFIHVSNLYYTKPQSEAAALLVKQSGMSKVFFCNSGTEANEAAIKIARKWGKAQHPDKVTILTLHDSFHGRTYGGLSATAQPKYQEAFGPMLEGFRYVPFNDCEAIKAAATEDVCAIMLEVIQGESGIKPVSEAFMKTVQTLCATRAILLIIDEVQTGIGRTGALFAHQHYGVQPDIITSAKGLGSGVPVGAVLCNEKADVLVKGDHGSTFGGNPLATTAVKTVLTCIQDEGLLNNAEVVGTYFEKALQALQVKYPVIVDVRGKGLLRAVELAVPARAVMEACIANGLIVVGSGTHTIRFLPPLIVTTDHIDEAVMKLEKALQHTL